MKLSKPLFITLLVLFNTVPAYGVVHWGWQSFDLIFLYWLENLLIGVFMITRMLIRPYGHPIELAFPVFLVPFFSFHYGMFCYVHGMFVVNLFGKPFTGELGGLDYPDVILPLIEQRHLLWPLMALMVFHLMDWLRDIGERGLGSDGIRDLTTAPYRRIMVLHITIIASGFALAALNEPMAGLFILIAFKTGVDIYHWDKDEKAATDKKLPEIDEKLKRKVDAFLEDPKITVNGKEVRYRDFEELKTSKHYSLIKAILRVVGGDRQFKAVEAYVEQQSRERKQS